METASTGGGAAASAKGAASTGNGAAASAKEAIACDDTAMPSKQPAPDADVHHALDILEANGLGRAHKYSSYSKTASHEDDVPETDPERFKSLPTISDYTDLKDFNTVDQLVGAARMYNWISGNKFGRPAVIPNYAILRVLPPSWNGRLKHRSRVSKTEIDALIRNDGDDSPINPSILNGTFQNYFMMFYVNNPSGNISANEVKTAEDIDEFLSKTLSGLGWVKMSGFTRKGTILYHQKTEPKNGRGKLEGKFLIHPQADIYSTGALNALPSYDWNQDEHAEPWNSIVAAVNGHNVNFLSDNINHSNVTEYIKGDVSVASGPLERQLEQDIMKAVCAWTDKGNSADNLEYKDRFLLTAVQNRAFLKKAKEDKELIDNDDDELEANDTGAKDGEDGDGSDKNEEGNTPQGNTGSGPTANEVNNQRVGPGNEKTDESSATQVRPMLYVAVSRGNASEKSDDVDKEGECNTDHATVEAGGADATRQNEHDNSMQVDTTINANANPVESQGKQSGDKPATDNGSDNDQNGNVEESDVADSADLSDKDENDDDDEASEKVTSDDDDESDEDNDSVPSKRRKSNVRRRNRLDIVCAKTRANLTDTPTRRSTRKREKKQDDDYVTGEPKRTRR